MRILTCWRSLFFFCILSCLTACGFHLQGQVNLAPTLKKVYLETNDPYGPLTKHLEQSLKMSNVQLVESRDQASAILIILGDNQSQQLTSVSGTQQTRQYNLGVTVAFEVTRSDGVILVPPQSITETQAITIQSNQILGSSNEANLLYQQMRRALAYDIMNRLASKDVTHLLQNSAH